MSGRSGPPPMKFGNPGDRLRKKRWNLDELPKFEKNFYTEHPEVQRMSQVSSMNPPGCIVVAADKNNTKSSSCLMMIA